MNQPDTLRKPLDEESSRQLAALSLLHQVIDHPEAFHAGLLEGDNELLEPLFDYMMREDLVSVGEDDHYQPTTKGRQAYQTLLHQQQSYLIHFDIYAAVDLAEGVFGDPGQDHLDAPNWSDLRVAVGEFKKIDPFRMVFLSMLADGSFFNNPDWKFDLVLGSSFFRELEEIVQSQIRVEELGYEDEDGTTVPGEVVLEDVILQGAKVNQERMERERRRQAALFDEEEESRRREDNGEEEWDEQMVYVPYDPWGPAGGYLASAMFVEALWLSAFW